MGEMRRKDREIEAREDLLHILNECKVIRVAMHDGEEIYLLPMNFGYTYEQDKLVFYLHAAQKGKKIDLLRENPRVAFEMDRGHELIDGQTACEYGFKFASIVGKGRAELVEELQEKIKALEILMKCQTGKAFKINEKMASAVAVIKIIAVEFSGKSRR